MNTCFVYTTVVLRLPRGLSMEVCVYAGADWFSSAVNQRVARGGGWGGGGAFQKWSEL